MTQKIAGFDWDDGNIGKCRKHGVALADNCWFIIPWS